MNLKVFNYRVITTQIILQVSAADTLDKGSVGNIQTTDWVVYIFLTIVGIGMILFLLPRRKAYKDATPRINPTVKPNNTQSKSQIEILKPVASKNQVDPRIAASVKETKLGDENDDRELLANSFEGKKIEIIIPEKDDQLKEKYIGYNPINIFSQTEPLYFPTVIMPKPHCVIKFPRKGRSSRRGFQNTSQQIL